jgi:hypothetical protein
VNIAGTIHFSGNGEHKPPFYYLCPECKSHNKYFVLTFDGDQFYKCLFCFKKYTKYSIETQTSPSVKLVVDKNNAAW